MTKYERREREANDMFIRIAEHSAAADFINDNEREIMRKLVILPNHEHDPICFLCTDEVVKQYLQKFVRNVDLDKVTNELQDHFRELLVRVITPEVLLDSFRRACLQEAE
jgi:hypothetical protein